MRLVIAALVFAALAITAAELGWFQPDLPTTEVSSRTAASTPRAPARSVPLPRELDAVPTGEDAVADDEVLLEDEDVGPPAALTVHLERGFDDFAELDHPHDEVLDELGEPAEPPAEPEVPPWAATIAAAWRNRLEPSFVIAGSGVFLGWALKRTLELLS